MFQIKYKLIDWVFDMRENLTWKGLSLNTCDGAMDILEQKCISKSLIGFHISSFDLLYDWHNLSYNCNDKAVDLLLKKENIDKISWHMLSRNTNNRAVALLKKYPHKIDWYILNLNACDEAIKLLIDNPDKINWRLLSYNTNTLASELIVAASASASNRIYHPFPVMSNEICWYAVSQNTNDNVVNMIMSYKHLIDFNHLCSNSNDKAVDFILQNENENINNINYEYLCSNENNRVMYLLADESKRHLLDWYALSSNTNDSAIALLKSSIDNIDWQELCTNTNINAIMLLQEHPDKINWSKLSANPSIFEMDKVAMREQCKPFAEELASVVFHPKRICALVDKCGFDILDVL